MHTYLISLISDNLIPNFLIAKEFMGQYDSMIFITTKKMREREIGVDFELAFGLPQKSVRRISVNEESWSDALRTLQNENLSNSDKYIVNYTCGTKPMSIAVSIFFSKINGTKFIYSPIGTNTYRENNDNAPHPILYRMSLKEYFLLYGITYESESPALKHSKKKLDDFFFRFHQKDPAVLGQINSARLQPEKHPDIQQRKYLAGEWFEEYIYARIISEYNIPDTAIAHSLKIHKKNSSSNNDNEIDVAFVYENTLHVIECKSSTKGNGTTSQKEFITNMLYKLAAISYNFGLVVKSYLFVATPIVMTGVSRDLLENRKRLLKIRQILDGRKFASRNSLKVMMQ